MTIGVEVGNQVALSVRSKDEIQKRIDTGKRIVTMVAHELRTPLTAIQGYAGLLRDGDAGPILDEQREMLDIIIRNSQRLASMVDTFLDLEKMESGKFQMDKRYFLLETVLEKVVCIFQADLQHTKVNIQTNIERALLVWGDQQQLLRVFSNLLSNATKFTDAGTVTLGAKKIRGKIAVEVIDQGEGISKEDLPHIYETFYQCRNERLSNPCKGNGLGLAMAKVIVSEHGGSILTKSKPGEGSTVLVELPLVEDRRRTL